MPATGLNIHDRFSSLSSKSDPAKGTTEREPIGDFRVKGSIVSLDRQAPYATFSSIQKDTKKPGVNR